MENLKMFFVMAIHTDSILNREYGRFGTLSDAEACELNMKRGRYPGDNYLVHTFNAETAEELEIKINEFRKTKNITVNSEQPELMK